MFKLGARGSGSKFQLQEFHEFLQNVPAIATLCVISKYSNARQSDIWSVGASSTTSRSCLVLFGYSLTDAFNWVGDAHHIHYSYVFFVVRVAGGRRERLLLILATLWSFCSASDDPKSGWLRSGRSTAFVGGVLFAMLLALIGGHNIAMMAWDYGVRHRG